MFTLKISTDNAAFADPGGAYELERILREAGEKVRFCVTDASSETASARVRDINGNDVGEWSLNARETEKEGALSPPDDSGTARPMVAAWGREPNETERATIGRELDLAAAGLSPEHKAAVTAWHLNHIAETARADLVATAGVCMRLIDQALALGQTDPGLTEDRERRQMRLAASAAEIIFEGRGGGSPALPTAEAVKAAADGEAFELASIQRGDETLPFPVHIAKWPREEGEEPCDPIAFVLSLASKPWVLQQVWGSLRLGGAEFPAKAEAEFAIALHWLVVHVLTPGTGGIDTIDEALKAMRSKLDTKPEPEPEAG